MKVKLKKTVTEEIETDIDFPIYRKDVFDHCVEYTKVVDEKKEINIVIYDDENKIEIYHDTPSFYGNEDYILGKGVYLLPEIRFNYMLERAKNIIHKITE